MKTKIYFIIIAAFLFASCGEPESPLQNLSAEKKHLGAVSPVTKAVEDARPYRYAGDSYRDPFEPISAGYQEGSITIPNINDLVLHGMVRDGNQSIAILRSGSYSYTLLNGRIYDSMQRLITGMSGIINTDNVVITSRDGAKREIKLRESDLPR